MAGHLCLNRAPEESENCLEPASEVQPLWLPDPSVFASLVSFLVV